MEKVLNDLKGILPYAENIIFEDCKFNLSKLDMTDITYKRVVQDDTYMPCVDMED